MTADEIVQYLANVPDDALTYEEMAELISGLVEQARALLPQLEILLRHIYFDVNWPDQVAIIPLRINGDRVVCWVGRPHEAAKLTLNDLESCPSTSQPIDFFRRNVIPHVGLDELPF